MNNKKAPDKLSPPGLIASLASGFNAVTNNIKIILIPILVDLLLWFGPQVGLKSLLLPVLNQSSQVLKTLNNPEVNDLIVFNNDLWKGILENFNLLSLLRTFPIGVPSLLAGRSIKANPLDFYFPVEIKSFGVAALAFILIGLIGILAGSYFFRQVSLISSQNKNANETPAFVDTYAQSILLSILIYVICTLVFIPLVILITFISALNTSFVQIGVILLILFLIWLLMPLLFSPHGIYTSSLNAFRSILTSIKMIRFFLPGTGIFLLAAITITQGLDILWQIPGEESWMLLIGIAGHAFITTSLFTASFIYYRGGLKWMQESIQRMSKLQESKLL